MTITWLRRTIFFGTGAYWLALFILTHTPVVLPKLVETRDKTAHFIGYAILGALLFASLRLLGRRDPTHLVLAVGMIYGAIDELLQIPVGRSCELNDWFADAAGLAFAVLACALVTTWRDRRAERSSW